MTRFFLSAAEALRARSFRRIESGRSRPAAAYHIDPYQPQSRALAFKALMLGTERPARASWVDWIADLCP